nr:acetyl-coenzyme A synthetase [Nocardioidaceae bacterium]
MTETTTPSDDALSNLLHENRRFEPPSDLAEHANVTAAEYEAAADPLAYWARQADRLDWATRWDTVLEWDPP